MEKFKTGFWKGDVIEQVNDRYVVVRDGFNTRTVVTDDGQRRKQFVSMGELITVPPLNKPAMSGELSLNDIKVMSILNLNVGDKIRVLGLSEVVGQDWDDDLVLTKKPEQHEDIIKLTFTYPSGVESEREEYIDLIGDIRINQSKKTRTDS